MKINLKKLRKIYEYCYSNYTDGLLELNGHPLLYLQAEYVISSAIETGYVYLEDITREFVETSLANQVKERNCATCLQCALAYHDEGIYRCAIKHDFLTNDSKTCEDFRTNKQ